MAQEVQIVPKYLHSHVETYINDYTQFEDEAVNEVDTNNKFICVFRSSKGIDNVLVKKTKLDDFKKTYGSSDYAKYGQPLMMPIAMLKSESATVNCMRVMPDDAFAANSILSLSYKMDEAAGKMIIKYSSSYIDKDAFKDDLGVIDTTAFNTHKRFKKELRIQAQNLRNDEPDVDGFKTIPLVTFRMAGRGVYGNDYRWRISRNTDYEYNYGIKMYSFEALNASNGIETESTAVGCLVTSQKYSGLTLINDILDNKENGSLVMDVQVFDDYVEDLYNEFVEFVTSLDADKQDEIPDIDEFDPLFGMGVASSTKNKNIEIMAETLNGDIISVDRVEGVPLSGGNDGAFDSSNDEQAIYEAEMECYTKAFQGDYDRFILSTRRTPCDALLDANYPFPVKKVLAELANLRESSICYMDAGIETTLYNVDNVIEEYSVFNTRNISKEFQHYTVKDYDTKKKCEVTVTFFYAQALAAHYHNYGSYIPFVKSYAQISGHVKNTLEPCITDLDMDLKEKLYINRINYFEEIEENVYQRCSQNTAQMENSDLLEENNMNTLFEIKKIVERDCWDGLYDFTSAESRALFSEVEQAKFSDWQGSRLDTISIEFSVNEWEAERSIVHCYIAVQFRTLNKRTIIEIDVNKRNFLG